MGNFGRALGLAIPQALSNITQMQNLRESEERMGMEREKLAKESELFPMKKQQVETQLATEKLALSEAQDAARLRNTFNKSQIPLSFFSANNSLTFDGPDGKPMDVKLTDSTHSYLVDIAKKIKTEGKPNGLINESTLGVPTILGEDANMVLALMQKQTDIAKQASIFTSQDLAKQLEAAELQVQKKPDDTKLIQTRDAIKDRLMNNLAVFDAQFGKGFERSDWVTKAEDKANLQYVGVSNDKDKAPVVFDPDTGGTFKNINGKLMPYSGQVEPKIEKQTTTIITPGQTATIAHGIRTEMRSNPIVRDYQEVVQKYNVMEETLKVSKTTKNFVAVDQALITLFNKMTDPTSVVRESEYARTPQNLSLINRIKGKAYKILEGGAGLTQDERNAITDMGRIFYKTYEKEYKFTVNNYKRMAKESGINPDLVSIPYETRPQEVEAKTIVRTGTDKKTGKKVIQYSDGSTEYAK